MYIWYKKKSIVIKKKKNLPRALIIIAKRWKQPRSPLTDEQISKWNMVYMYNGIPLRLKKARILTPATTWIDLEDPTSSGISQSQKDKHCMILLSEDKNKSVMLVLYVRENKPCTGEYGVSLAMEHSSWGIWGQKELRRALEEPCRDRAFDGLGVPTWPYLEQGRRS